MELPQLRFQILLDILKPEARGGEPAKTEAIAPPVAAPGAGAAASGAAGMAATPARPRRRLPPLLVFATGLLVGWMVFGWWVWPVNWVNSAPWQMQPQYQRTYLALVADSYAGPLDLPRVEKMVAGWQRDDLATLLAAMQNETSDPRTRQRLATLATALRTGAPPAATNAILSQPLVLGSTLLAMLPLVAAGLLIAVPRLKRKQPRPEPVASAAVPAVPTVPAASAGAAPESDILKTMAAQSTEPSDPAAPPASKPVEALPTAGLEQAALPAEPNLAKQPPTGQPIERLNEVAQPPAAKPAPAEQNGEPRIAAEKKPANQDGEPKPAEQPQAAKPAEPEKPAEQRKAEALGGLLSLFEDEEATLTALDELCRTLPNIEVDELLAGCRQALQQFQMSAPLAYEMAEERAR